ncbi:cytochrome P450 [Umbelopsis sp. PMI_123]|nr:cytochrome P450 [Umbelopsis sp. PMI_123]
MDKSRLEDIHASDTLLAHFKAQDQQQQILEALGSLYSKYIQSYVKRNSPRTVIAAAVAAFFSYQIYKMARVPKNLRHIPAVPYLKYMRSVLSGEGIDIRTRDIILPVVENSPNGLYLRPNQFGWSVGVAGPSAMKTLLLRKLELLFNKFAGLHNIVVLNDDVWKKHRMIANPAFHRSMPVTMFGRLNEKKMLQFEKEGDGLDKVDIPMFLQRFTLDVIGLAAFGYDFEARHNLDNEKVNTYNDIMDGITQPIYIFFPILEKYFLWAMPGRRAELLTLMLEANEDSDDDKYRLTNSELQDDLAILFLAGHDTTSNALLFALYHLAVNPKKLENEVIGILGDGNDVVYPTASQCTEMKYVYMIMKETMRISPPAQNTSLRWSNEDIELDGSVIPKGSSLSADTFVLNQRPSVWDDSEEFIPERFGPGGECESKAEGGFSWVPFGSGGRQCIGMNFSLAEQKVVLAMMLRKFKWPLPKNSSNKDHLEIGGSLGIISPEQLHLKFTKRFKPIRHR